MHKADLSEVLVGGFLAGPAPEAKLVDHAAEEWVQLKLALLGHGVDHLVESVACIQYVSGTTISTGHILRQTRRWYVRTCP